MSAEVAATFTHDGPGTPAAAWANDPRTVRLAPADDLTSYARVVVLAAHPDDESLGAGGLVATAHRLGIPVELVLCTAGEASHPDSRTHPPERLATIRRHETADALAELGPASVPRFLEVPDGAVARHEGEVVERLVVLLGDARDTLLVAPWRYDGHPDHDAAGRAAAAAALRTGATLWEYPVWFWHWGDPDRAPWARMRRLPLDAPARAAKGRAQAAHRSQVQALSPEPGDEVLLGPGLLEHFAGAAETFVLEPVADDTLDDLHADDADPWGADSRWYERRKRDLLLAALPRPSYDRGLEVGVSRGALARALANRCRSLLAVDAGAHAVAAARERLADLPQVEVERRRVPEQWPTGAFDLVVLSEVGYFLSPVAVERLVARVAGSLTSEGVLVLAHWRHPVEGWVLDGPDVHAVFRAAAGRALPPVAASYLDRDVEILVLAPEDQWPVPTR